MTQAGLAEALHCTPASIRHLHKEGLPRVYVGKAQKGRGSRPRYDLARVKAWLELRAKGRREAVA